jgi:uncharacterized membrane protein YdbT with pleckstrin-like domain
MTPSASPASELEKEESAIEPSSAALDQAERVLWEGSPSYGGRVGRLFLATGLVFLGGLGVLQGEGALWAIMGTVGAWLWLHAIWRRGFCRYRVTSLVAVEESGMLSRRVRQLRLCEVCGIEMEQGFFNRLLGVGSVHLSSGGLGGIVVSFEGIRNPETVRKIVAREAKR